MKKILFTLLLICGFSTTTNAQFYDEILLFIEVGKTIDDSSRIIYLHFDDDGNMYESSMSKSTVRDKYKQGVLEEYGVNQKHNITRDRSINSSRYSGIYSCKRKVPVYGGIYGYGFYEDGKRYFGISNDEMVMWNTTNNSNEAQNKKYYKAIDPSDLVPKEVEYDFL